MTVDATCLQLAKQTGPDRIIADPTPCKFAIFVTAFFGSLAKALASLKSSFEPFASNS
jgi:hypothetical protein